MPDFMLPMFTVSVSDKIEQYGAYAGFAAVVGLAVLSLLYFAQAREVKRLREWAGRAPERAAEQLERVTAGAQRRVIAQPVPPQQPGAQRPGAPAAQPATPAAQAQAQQAGAAAAAATAAGATIAAKPGAPGSPSPATAAQPTTVPPVPGTNGASATPKDGPGAAAAKAPDLPKPGVPATTAAGAAAPARPPQPLRVPTPTATTGRRWPDDEDDEPTSPLRTTLAIVGAVAVVLIIGIVVITKILGGDDSPQPRSNTISRTTAGSNSRSTQTTSKGAATPAMDPSKVTVAVLNGTTVTGLARGVATRIENKGYKIGAVTNATDQGRSATLVEFAPDHRAEALAVARLIGLDSDAVQQLTDATRVIAGEGAIVVVTVGGDQQPQQ